MSTKTKTLAKSLHTVTVIVTVARLYKGSGIDTGAEGLVDRALVALGYDGASDPYGLAAKAAELLRKEG